MRKRIRNEPLKLINGLGVIGYYVPAYGSHVISLKPPLSSHAYPLIVSLFPCKVSWTPMRYSYTEYHNTQLLLMIKN